MIDNIRSLFIKSCQIKQSYMWSKAVEGKLITITGNSFSEGLILASTNQQHDKRLFIQLQVQYMKIESSEHGKTWGEHVVYKAWSPHVLSSQFSCTYYILNF